MRDMYLEEGMILKEFIKLKDILAKISTLIKCLFFYCN